jgi:hypothetical protein
LFCPDRLWRSLAIAAGRTAGFLCGPSALLLDPRAMGDVKTIRDVRRRN